MSNISVCLVGAGAIGMVHLDGYLQETDTTVCVVESDPTKRAAVEAKGIETVATLEDALQRNVDLYDICLPTHLHVPTTKIVLEKTDALILCEKPLALNMKEVEALAAVPGAQKRVFCALVERFNEPFVAMKKWTVSQKPPLTMDFKRRTKKPVYAPWFQKPELGGDILYDLAVHDVDLALWFAEAPVVGVSNHTYRDDDRETFTLTFENGTQANIHVGWDLPEDDPKGIENIVRIKSDSGEITYDSDHETLDDGTVRAVRPRFPEAYYDELREALRIVRGNDSRGNFASITEAVEGMKTLSVIAKDRSTR